jgi:hypothetical protein
MCGNEYDGRASSKYCCESCRRKAMSKRQQARNAARRKAEKNKPISEIARISRLAREAGMSYGRYVAEKGL